MTRDLINAKLAPVFFIGFIALLDSDDDWRTLIPWPWVTPQIGSSTAGMKPLTAYCFVLGRMGTGIVKNCSEKVSAHQAVRFWITGFFQNCAVRVEEVKKKALKNFRAPWSTAAWFSALLSYSSSESKEKGLVHFCASLLGACLTVLRYRI